MGTASTTKYIMNNAGQLTEQPALTTSAGAADTQRVPALNASGVLDASIVNSKTTSAGAGDTGKLVALDAAGKIDSTMMPTGVGADTRSIMTSEAIGAGEFVNVWNSAGEKVRKADGTSAGKEANGFVLAAFGAGVNATVHFEGTNTAVAGQTPGPVFLSITAGAAAAAAPSAAGNIVQRVGVATSPTSINFQMGPTLLLA